MAVVHIFKGDFKVKILKEERGFSLIEVVASLVIITIVLLSFSQLFIQSNKTAAYNSEKILLINLADAELERIKIDPFTFFNKPLTNPINTKKTKTILLNKQNYNITITASQNTDEFNMKIFNVLVTSSSNNSNAKVSVEGYVVYD